MSFGLTVFLGMLAWSTAVGGHEDAPLAPLVFRCRADNDLYRVMSDNGHRLPRYDTVAEAIAHAAEGAGVLVLADGYPQETTPVDASLFAQAAAKRLRLYVEYPAMLPDLEVGRVPAQPKTGTYGAVVERAVVTSDAFGPDLKKMRIVMIHGCHYLPVEAKSPHLVLARVSGYDTAVYGVPQEVHPILFEHPRGDILVATTKLSQFVTARYAPTEAWGPVWQMILGWLQPGKPALRLTWTPTVRPSFGKSEPLAADVQKQAVERAVSYYGRSRLYVHPSWPKDTGIDPIPAAWPAGDATHGIGECYISKRIFCDGTQAVSRSLRADCNLEAAMGLACGAAVLGTPPYQQTAQRLNDFVFFNSTICEGSRTDPQDSCCGLLRWNTESEGYWGDDNARGLLSALTAAAMLKSDRWDEPILRGILANFRTTGPKGFRPLQIARADLQKNGWRHYYELDHVDYCPHMQAWLGCTYLWLYDKTKYEPLLERARTGLALMMEAYPHWRLEANRVEAERCRMLLPLAWLVRVDDTPEHRRWLDTIARYVIDLQDASGAIPQVPGTIVASNEDYGASECALAHQAGDPVTDRLYTGNFAFIGMHEAAAATGEDRYAQSAAKMADFFLRSQTRSAAHPELDGTWYRGFDFAKWDYWGSDGDAGWGVWTNEIGWTHSWITTTLSLREMKTSLWELTKNSTIARHFDTYRSQMLPGETTTDSEQSSRNEPYRPQFHFTYQKGWLSDINGLVFYGGEYHLFSQHCPAGPALDYPNTHWGHAVSRDLVHWQELPPALAPDAKDGPIFSGSAVVDWNNTAGFQTGEEKALVAIYTGGRYVTDDSQDGVICLAYSNDRGRTWTKYANNPVLPAITHLNRDPKVFWHEPTKSWIMAITLSCGGWRDGDYRFALFSSPDLKTWKETSRLEMPNGIDCPDLFQLPVDGDPKNTRWVFWSGDGTHAIGSFDGRTFTREGEIRLPWCTWEENGANGYAAQTFNDMPNSDGRTVQVSWLRHGAYPGMPFNQQASFPCELSLRSTPEGIMLCRYPVKEIELLHGDCRHWADTTLAPGENLLKDVRGGLSDVRAEIELGAARRIAFEAYGIPVVYDVEAKTLLCFGKSIPLAPRGGRVSLRLLVDRTSLEVFGNDGLVSMSYCFVPQTLDAHLGLSADGAPVKIVSLDVFDMQSMWSPRMTKIGTVDTAHQADGSFIHFQNRLYHLRWEGTENGYASGYFQFVDDETGEAGPPFARGYGCGQAMVDGGTVYVSTVSDVDRPDGQNKIFLHTSNDLVHWQTRPALDLPGWFVFKASMCKAENRYVMMLETFKAPSEGRNGAFCRFAESPDMVHWTLTPPECWFDNGDGFACGHFLRYVDGKFYVFYLGKDPTNAGWAMNVTRSGDLVQWEKSPLNPVLRASAEDRTIANPKLTAEQRAWIATKTDINNSDMYYIEHDGRVLIDYFWDDQTADPVGRGVGRAVYAGTEAQFLHSWFREK